MPCAQPKLRIPPTAVAPVHRERLLAVLDDRSSPAPRPVIVVSGPAGAGKTTMLATWAAELGRRRADSGKSRVAWVTLDERDNDPALLWSAVANALTASGVPGATPDPAGLITAISAECDPVHLILDETDHLHEETALRGLETVLRQIPDNLRLVLAARTPPRLHLSRLRLEGRLLEIGTPELAFTAPEAETLFRNHRLRLSQADLDLLVRRTEGWPAGLRLAAMSLGDETGRSTRLEAFPAGDPALADYLTEEVLERFPHHVHQFLRATSVCEVVCADLATALAGLDDSGDILDQLERANSLIERVDRPGVWYRCHPVLRGVLLAELDRLGPSVSHGLHKTAAHWFRDQGQPLTALEHAVAAGHNQLITELVEAHGLQEILNGQAASLHRLLNDLPAPPRTMPFTALVGAAAALDIGDTPAADHHLSIMDKLGRPARFGYLRTLHSTVMLHRARIDGRIEDPPEVITTAAQHRSGDPDLDTLSMLTSGIALVAHGELDQAERILRQALELAGQGHREHAVLQCLIELAAIAGARGDLARMDEEAGRAIEFAATKGWARSTHCAGAYAMRGAYAHLQLDSDRAKSFCALAKELLQPGTEPPVALVVFMLDRATAFDTPDLAASAVEEVRERWRKLSKATVAPQLITSAALAVLPSALRAGQQEWATELAASVEAATPLSAERAVVDAIIQAHKGRHDQARRLLAPVLSKQLQPITVIATICAWLLEACLLAAAEDWHRAHSAITKALGLAEPLSALRPFLDGGPPVRDLLVRGVGRFGKLDRFVSMALTKLPASAAPPVDQLTSREQDLLIELPSMRTTEEIADSLFVSVNTVKTHLRGIYRKLGVNHRRDAVAVARRRGLI